MMMSITVGVVVVEVDVIGGMDESVVVSAFLAAGRRWIGRETRTRSGRNAQRCRFHATVARVEIFQAANSVQLISLSI